MLSTMCHLHFPFIAHYCRVHLFLSWPLLLQYIIVPVFCPFISNTSSSMESWEQKLEMKLLCFSKPELSFSPMIEYSSPSLFSSLIYLFILEINYFHDNACSDQIRFLDEMRYSWERTTQRFEVRFRIELTFSKARKPIKLKVYIFKKIIFIVRIIFVKPYKAQNFLVIFPSLNHYFLNQKIFNIYKIKFFIFILTQY